MMRIQGTADSRRPQSKNKRWVAGHNDGKNGHASDGERWDRGGHRRRGGGRGRDGHGHHGTHLMVPTDIFEEGASGTEDEGVSGAESAHEEEHEPSPPEPETPEEREKFYQELVKQREIERKRAIAEGKMDDPLVPKRLEEAITMVGTCMDMCPRFERYRRERENNLDKREVIPGTKRVDHKRAVKIYERAAGDKTLPSDLRPPPVLKKTLTYLFHELLVKEGFSQTHDFIRDRSRAVRNDFTMQHETGALAIECHDRCARYHILALHMERENPRFSVALEEQQLMYTLQSLKEFYDDQRGRYQAPTELEMRVYHRLIHIRDQKERHEEIPDEIRNHPVFHLTTQFRLRVQAKSAPITKTSKLAVDAEAMQIFSQLATVLREQNNVVMIYLVACIMERLFGKECIDDIESIRGDLSIPEIIDGVSRPMEDIHAEPDDDTYIDSPRSLTEEIPEIEAPVSAAQPVAKGATEWLTNNFGTSPPKSTPDPSQSVFASLPSSSSSAGPSAFSTLSSTSSAFGSRSAFPSSAFPASATFPPSASLLAYGKGTTTFGPTSSASAPLVSIFGGGSAPKSVFASPPASVFGPSTSNTLLLSTPPASAAPAQAPPPVPTTAPARAPLASQPTWPAESLSLASTPSAPSIQPAPSPKAAAQPSPESAPSKPAVLSPFAPSFIPPQVTLPSSAGRPPIFSDPFAPPAGPSASPPKQAIPPSSGGIFTVPLVILPQPPSVPLEAPSVAPEDPDSREKTPPPSLQTPSRIVERRQTLWDLPGSSSPFSRLKEERMTFTPPPGSTVEPRTPISPTAPPPALGRVGPIALPPTPTARWFDPTSQPQESGSSLSKKRSLLHFLSLTLPAPAQSDILSPIHITTPTPGKTGLSVNGGPSPLYQSHIPRTGSAPQPIATDFPAPESTPPSLLTPTSATASKVTPRPKPMLEIQTNGFSPSPPRKGKEETKADLDTMAGKFLRTSLLLKQPWTHWRKRAEDVRGMARAWGDACRRGDSYQARVQRGHLATSFSSSALPSAAADHSSKKRRISVPTEVASAQVRRIKRRRSNQFVQPLTDEALAQRLQQNYEENERRWAQGSFRQAVFDRLKARIPSGDELPEWCLWLSMNTENDKTAIWLEHKFDVPSSGFWVSENVFSMPAFEKPKKQGSPGLIVFEQTPLEGVDDEIERKYRVLDDCARLRDVLEALPPVEDRHYMPCLLVVNWSENEDSAKTRDLVDMTHKLVREGAVKHVAYFNVSATAKELDKKFAAIIDVTPLDTEDRLLVPIGWKDIKELFVAPAESAISDILDTCWPDDEFDWIRYERVLLATGEILNSALRAILSLFNDTPLHVVIEIPEDLPQPSAMGRGYATGQFAEALARLLLSSTQELLGSRLTSPVPIADDVVDAAMQRVEKVINAQADKLRRLAADAALRASVSTSVGPSPKRQASEEDLRLHSSTSSKRLRPSPSVDGVGEMDGDGDVSVSPPPSTSATTDTSEKPLVTVAMLRALTRDVLKSYGK